MTARPSLVCGYRTLVLCVRVRLILMSGRWNRCGGAILTMRAYRNFTVRGDDNDRRDF